MMNKVKTSLALALIMPFTYFLFVTVTSLNIYDSGSGVLLSKASGSTGIKAFIELNGLAQSILLYAKSTLYFFIFTFLVCNVYDFFNKKSVLRQQSL